MRFRFLLNGQELIGAKKTTPIVYKDAKTATTANFFVFIFISSPVF